MISDYFNLPFDVGGVRCPYFNNARLRQRAQLSVLVGKGTPAEIADEARIVSRQYKKGIFDNEGHCCVHSHSPEEHISCIRRFLIDNNLGVDCSGLVAHVLTRHFLESKKIDLRKKMFIAAPRNFFRWLIGRLRPIEQMSVSVFASDANSSPLDKISELRAGDLIVMLKTGPRRNRNHMLLVTGTENGSIAYVHSRAWQSEGQYGHGVSGGVIKITSPGAGLLQQEWSENGCTGGANETLTEAGQAEVLQMRRLKF